MCMTKTTEIPLDVLGDVKYQQIVEILQVKLMVKSVSKYK